MKNSTRRHELSESFVFSTGTQCPPLSFVISTRQKSVPGAPPALLLYQRQYSITGRDRPAALKSVEYKVVCPPSTSLVPGGSLAAALPVTKHIVAGSGVWSTSGCTGIPPTYVPIGASRTHTPVVASSLGSPTVHPWAVSKSYESCRIGGPTRNTFTLDGAPGGSTFVSPDRSLALM